MIFTTIIIPVLSLVVIFLFSIGKFSKQIHQVADQKFKEVLHSFTASPLRGVAAGTIFTSLIQSSTATTVILAGLVNAGLLPFTHSLGVIIGANIGTTMTSQLVAFRLANVAPYVVLLGFLVTYFGRGFKNWGKPIFYFGMIFFSLSLISLYIEPVKSNPDITGFFSSISSLPIALLVGIVFTAIIQSSSVTSGLVVLLVGSNLLSFGQAIGIILGANLGTTATTLLASISMNVNAKKVALAHFLFNLIGIAIFLPFIEPFTRLVLSLGGSAQQQVANAHVLFNVVNAVIFLIFIRQYERLVSGIIGVNNGGNTAA